MAKEQNKKEQKVSAKKYLITIMVGVAVVLCFALLSENTERTQSVKAVAPIAVKIEQPVVKNTEENMARIDISAILAEDEKPQFMIYVDGSETPLKNALWMHNIGLYGFTLQKNGKSLDIVIKALNDVEIKFSASGIQKLDKNKNNIPVWVEYTSFNIDGTEVLDKVERVWFKKPFTYELDVKAGREYKIHTEWHKDSKI